MAKTKKRADTRFQKHFRYEGKQYTVYGNTPTEAEAAKVKKLEELQTGIVDRENPRLNDYYERFTENRRNTTKAATIRGQVNQYKKCAAIVIYNGVKFGDMRVRDIRPRDIQVIKKALEEKGNSTRTINDALSHLSHLFNAAVIDETIDKNPCRSISKLKRTEPPARDTIHRALTEEETQLFIKAAEEEHSIFLNVFKLMLNTGMRIGEIGALMEADIDRKYIHIKRTITRNEYGNYCIGDSPKTADSVRDIPLNDNIKAIIRDQRQLNAMLYGALIDSTKPLFRSARGFLLKEASLNREIKRLAEKCGIDYFSSHALRATFATHFMRQTSGDFKTLQAILGHADATITLNLYSHTLEDTKISAMQNFTIAM